MSLVFVCAVPRVRMADARCTDVKARMSGERIYVGGECEWKFVRVGDRLVSTRESR